MSGADDGIRTRGLQIGNLTLYQLSYIRKYSQRDLNSHCRVENPVS
jgi:hypothetical protein